MEREKIRQNANFCRLILYMCKIGADAIEYALLDVVFNCLLEDERERIEQADLEHVKFEELFPSNGQLAKLNDFDDCTIKKVFRMSNQPGTALDFLRRIGLNMILSSYRKKLYRYHQRIGKKSWNKIDTQQAEVDIKNLDVSVMVFIIRNIPIGLERNWNDMPKEEEVSMKDDVCRICQYRNILAHYRATKPINDEDFDTMWSALTSAFKRLHGDPCAIDRDSNKLKIAPIDDQQQQKYEELVDEWVMEELENVEILKRHISLTHEDSAKQIVRDVSATVETSLADSKKHTSSELKSTEKRITECVERCMEETLTKMKDHTSMIVANAQGDVNKLLERTYQATKNELGTLIHDSLECTGSNIETRISAVVEDKIAGMSSTLTESVKQEVGQILTSHFEKVVEDVGKKAASIVNDSALRTIESLLAERVDQFTAYILNKVTEEVITSSRSEILEEIVRKTADTIAEKMAEDNRRQFDTLAQQYASRHPDTSLTPRKSTSKQPTDSMKVQVQAWYIDNQDFFKTHASKTIEEFLESNKHLTVIGPPLSGKTVIARNTALCMRSKGYTVFPISDPCEIDGFLSEKGGQIFIIENPIGKDAVDESRLKEWHKVDERLRTCIRNVDVKIIWIMDSQQVRDDIFRTSGLIFTENRIDITKLGLSCEERRGIVARYLKRTFVEDDNAYVNILDVAANCSYFFFPKICSELRRISKWQQTPGSPFLFPFEVLVDYFERIMHSNKHQFIALGLCAILGRLPSDRKFLRHSIEEGKRHMTCNFENCDIESALQSMDGIWITETEDYFEFSDEIYRDVILFLMRKRLLDPSTVLMNLSCRSIRQRVRYNPDILDEVPQEYIFNLEKRDWKELSFHICHDLLHLREGLNLEEGHNEETFKEKYQLDVIQELKNALISGKLCNDDFIAVIAFSVQTENAEMIDTLLQNQPSGTINAQYNETMENSKMGIVGFSTPLHFAVSKSSLWGVHKLLELGRADINILSEEGYTPLDIAVKNNDQTLVFELIKHGADLNKRSNKGLCPVHLAIQLNYVEIVCTLVKGRADMTLCTPEGLTPLHFAIYRDNSEVVKKMLELDIDTNICNREDKPALNFAIEQTELDVSIIEMLVAHPKTDVNCLTYLEGYDHSLHIAVILENVPAVTALVNSGRVNTNCLDYMASTPLHIAARNNNEKIALLLLKPEAGANVHLKDINGKTPWQIANEHGHKKLAKIIECFL